MLNSILLYLDPGSGSMLLSAVAGIIATLYFLIKGVFFKLLNMPAYLSGKRTKSAIKDKIVFYSEGGQYWNVFKPIIEELNHREISCLYLTSKENDEGLSCGLDHVKTKYIGEGNKAYFVLNTLSAELLIMTTPGVDVLQIKRSRGVRKYVHITHSAGGCSGYATYGVDYYDVVLTGGTGDKAMIEDLERARGTHKKDIRIIGCTYLDVLRKKLRETDAELYFERVRPTIMLSPTWGLHGLLRKSGETILKQLTLLDRYNIIVRPHPQAFISDKDVMEKLTALFPDSETLRWDNAPDGLNSMRQSDMMISDFSGVLFDYIFLFEKPVLSFKGHYDKRGHDSMDLSDDPWNLRMLEKTGLSISHDDLSTLPDIVENQLKGGTAISTFLDELRDGMDKYPDLSGIRGADAVESLLMANDAQIS
ncbi:MAG: CDP-glycerol glycerophosphotransferase family protein [Deltaproteobacteria bacterium]|nr:CDP-glycerol glycerophosphotransferase family protein [Deltaproteobacteria bacterium]